MTGSAHLGVSFNVHVKAAAAVAGAVASGAVTVEELETTIDVLEGAHDRGVSPDTALEELEASSPSMAQQLRAVLGKPVTWSFLSFVVNLARFLLDATRHG